MDAHLTATLISLPAMPGDTALLASALAVLVALAVAARSLLAWQGLAARSAAARRRQKRIEELEVGLHAELDELRHGLQALNADAERALWWLPRLDARLADAAATLASKRDTLHALTRDESRAMRSTFTRIRGTLNVLSGMRELRRTILG